MASLSRARASLSLRLGAGFGERRTIPSRGVVRHWNCIVRAASSANDNEAELAIKLEIHAENQRRLKQRTSESQAILYCRDHSANAVWKWLRGITIDVSCDFRRWRALQSPYRNVSLWTPKNIVRSDNIRRLIFPDLVIHSAVATGVCYYNSMLADISGLSLILPIECFTLTSVALGLLVTFKTQMAYGRFLEGRNLWGLMINESRAITSRILSRVPSHRGQHGDPEVVNAQKHAVKLIRSFPFTVKYHVTEDGCNPHIPIKPDTSNPEVNSAQEAELKASTALALRAELEQIWDAHDEEEREFLERLMAPEVGNRPLHVLFEVTRLNADVFAHPELGGLDNVAATEMDRSVTTFHNVLGACEKILRTPIYTPYSKFTGRFLSFWSGALPMALYPMFGPIGTVPVSIVISFFMLGIEDIGSRVEQPFNVMPLWQYCDTIDQSCLQLVRAADVHKRPHVPAYGGGDDDDDGHHIPSKRLLSFADPLTDFPSFR